MQLPSAGEAAAADFGLKVKLDDLLRVSLGHIWRGFDRQHLLPLCSDLGFSGVGLATEEQPNCDKGYRKSVLLIGGTSDKASHSLTTAAALYPVEEFRLTFGGNLDLEPESVSPFLGSRV